MYTVLRGDNVCGCGALTELLKSAQSASVSYSLPTSNMTPSSTPSSNVQLTNNVAVNAELTYCLTNKLLSSSLTHAVALMPVKCA
jgi:hypothetical protein